MPRPPATLGRVSELMLAVLEIISAAPRYSLETGLAKRRLSTATWYTLMRVWRQTKLQCGVSWVGLDERGEAKYTSHSYHMIVPNLIRKDEEVHATGQYI